ncbi:MAG TPA: hypothetical protein PKI07_12970, partial [Verrucomicrobiota bacterium]|nr:hypothetical protein [Verrucomicrobiota bacterium]
SWRSADAAERRDRWRGYPFPSEEAGGVTGGLRLRAGVAVSARRAAGFFRGGRGAAGWEGRV